MHESIVATSFKIVRGPLLVGCALKAHMQMTAVVEGCVAISRPSPPPSDARATYPTLCSFYEPIYPSPLLVLGLPEFQDALLRDPPTSAPSTSGKPSPCGRGDGLGSSDGRSAGTQNGNLGGVAPRAGATR